MHGDHDKVVGDWKFTLIFKASATDALAAMPNCKRPPKIVRCAFGNQRALRRGPDPVVSIDFPVTDSGATKDAKDAKDAPIEPEAVVAALSELALLGDSSPVPFIRRNGDDGSAYALFYFTDLKGRFALEVDWDVAETLAWPSNVTIVAGKQDRLLKVRIPEPALSAPLVGSVVSEPIPHARSDDEEASSPGPTFDGEKESKGSPSHVDILDLVESVAGSMLDDSQIQGQSVPAKGLSVGQTHFKHSEGKNEYPF
jgi:hypothetical protein